MRFKDLTEEDILYIAEVHGSNDTWDSKMQRLTGRFGKSERTIRRWIKKLDLANYSRPVEESPEFKKAKEKKIDGTKNVFFFTWAQSETPVHKKFFENLLAYAEYRNAGVHVIAGRYRNPTSLRSSKNVKKMEWWVDDVKPYLDANRHDPHPLLTILSDIKVQPTASNPLSGFDSVSDVKSSIIGHPKVHLKSQPVLEGHPFKILATTGACTVPNYTDTKAGAKGEFHHTFGFIIAEIEDQDTVHLRQVTANLDGSFCDLDKRVSKGEIEDLKKVGHIVLGDLHPHILDYNFYSVGILDFLDRFKPNHVVLHDVFDGHSISHWHEQDPIKMWEKVQDGSNELIPEIEHMKEIVRPLIKYSPIVVKSNHDDFLDRWVRRGDWKKDLANAEAYIDLVSAIMKKKAPKGLIAYELNKEFGKDIRCLDRDESCIIDGIELSNHGDKGINGARGSLNSYSKLNTKLTVGHSHSCGRLNGCIQVGTSSILRPDYAEGPSSWRHAHCIGHTDGKRQLIIFSRNYTYTTFND